MRKLVPYLECGLRNQVGITPSSLIRLSTPLAPTIAVLTAPDRISAPMVRELCSGSLTLAKRVELRVIGGPTQMDQYPSHSVDEPQLVTRSHPRGPLYAEVFLVVVTAGARQ